MESKNKNIVMMKKSFLGLFKIDTQWNTWKAQNLKGMIEMQAHSENRHSKASIHKDFTIQDLLTRIHKTKNILNFSLLHIFNIIIF